MLYYLIAFFLALIPFTVNIGMGDGIRTPKEVLSVIALLVISLFGLQYMKPFRNRYLCLFVVWCYITTLFNQYTAPIYLENVILKMPVVFFAWKELFYITIAFFTISIVSSANLSILESRPFLAGVISFKPMEKKSYIGGFANVINCVTIIGAVYAFIQFMGFDDIFRVADLGNKWLGPTRFSGHFNHRIVSTIGNPSLLGSFTAMCLPFSLLVKNKKLKITGLLLGLLTILLTFSSTAVFATMASFLIFVIFTKKYKTLGVIITAFIILIGVLFSTKTINRFTEYFNPTGRIEIHKVTWDILKNRPLLGMGLGTFEYLVGTNPIAVKKMNGENWRELHDEYGQIWFSTGLVGLSLICLFLFSTMRQFLKNVTRESTVLASSFIAFLVVCLTLFPMRVGPLSFYACIITGLFLRSINKENVCEG